MAIHSSLRRLIVAAFTSLAGCGAVEIEQTLIDTDTTSLVPENPRRVLEEPSEDLKVLPPEVMTLILSNMSGHDIREMTRKSGYLSQIVEGSRDLGETLGTEIAIRRGYREIYAHASTTLGGMFQAVRLSPDGKIIAAALVSQAEHSILFFDLPSGRVLKRVPRSVGSGAVGLAALWLFGRFIFDGVVVVGTARCDRYGRGFDDEWTQLARGAKTAGIAHRAAAQRTAAEVGFDFALDEAGQGSSFCFARGVERLGVVADDFVEERVFGASSLVCVGGHAAATEQQRGRGRRLAARGKRRRAARSAKSRGVSMAGQRGGLDGSYEGVIRTLDVHLGKVKAR